MYAVCNALNACTRLEELGLIGYRAYRLHVRISQPNGGCWFMIKRISWLSFHVHYYDELDASVGEPAVHGQPLINSLQQSKILVCRLMRQTSLEDVQA